MDEQSPDHGTRDHLDERTDEASRAKPPARRRQWKLKALGAFLILLPFLVYAAWAAITLNWTYSSGDRAGYVQKFSHKGWICKTWEGEIAMVNLPGAAPERFAFTVRNDSVAQAITRLMGSRVSLTYQEHRGVPGSCFGDTRYYVTAVRAIP